MNMNKKWILVSIDYNIKIFTKTFPNTIQAHNKPDYKIVLVKKWKIKNYNNESD